MINRSGSERNRTFACQKRLFDTFDENLRIFIEEEEDCGNLKISRFSERFPDRRYYFPAACALRKYKRDVHAAALDS